MVGLDRPLKGAPGYGTFRTRDGGWVALGIMNEDHFWGGLCRALGLDGEELLDNAERNRRVREINARIGEVIGELTQAEALERLGAHDVPASPVLDRDGMLAHPHFRERGTVVETDGGRAGSGPLVRFEQRPGRPPHGAPAVGAARPVWLPREAKRSRKNRSAPGAPANDATT
jgi:crotonobetainyl-CoA:carnitine CoA-transferase CaiB-like acyl-CoA transferase